MNLDTFSLFSSVHIVALAACVLIPAGVALAGRRLPEDSRSLRILRWLVALGCLIVWIVSTTFWFQPAYFRWDIVFPLQFCNLANLLGAAAVIRQTRMSQSLLYFWSFGLCIWAFLTPSLDEGPTHVWFWIFWIYHLFILISVVFVLAVDRFRPSWKDYRSAVLVTLLYMAALAVLNYFTGWNYGFVGSGTPLNPSPVDVLGPYPLRLLWMVLIGSTVFALLTLPWLRKNSVSLPEK